MKRSRLIGNSLRCYWRTNLAIALGMAVGTAVLAGALIVGDSIRGSMKRMTLERLGAVDYALVAQQFFGEELARDLGDASGFAEQFGRPSIERRSILLAALEKGEITEDELPHDILTALVRHRHDPELGLTDDFLVIREAATYLQGGTHTSSQTLVNALDLLIDSREHHPGYWERVKADIAFAQRCMHETLRLRPTTPKAKRRAEDATKIGNVEIPKGALVILDLNKANRDPEVFGEDAEAFNPDRDIASRMPRWGLSFGGGPHICPGRKVAGGLPQFSTDGDLGETHLYGLVAMMIQSIVQREPARHPKKPQSKDDRTERFTRWREYWVTFGNQR